MKRYSIKLVFRTLCLAIVGSTVVAGWADGLRNPPESPAALARGGGKIAHIDDASATTVNPANLTDLTTNQILASATIGYAVKDFEAPDGSKADSEDPLAVLPNFFATWQATPEISAGVALTTPFGRSATFDKDGALRNSAPYFSQIGTVNLNPAMAMRVSDNVSVGVGIDILASALEFKQIVPWSAVLGAPGIPDGRAKFEADGAGVGGNLGVSIDVCEGHRLSLTYRSPIKVDMEGDASIDGIPPGLPGPLGALSPRSDFETDIEYPGQIAIGYGIELTDKVRFEVDVEWIEHSSFDSLPLDADNNSPILPGREIVTDWDDNWVVGFGADWKFAPQWIARCGYTYLESPVPDQTLFPAVAEDDEHVISAGVGYTEGRHSVDATYAIGIFNGDREITDNQNPAYNGTYSFEAHLLAFAYGYTF